MFQKIRLTIFNILLLCVAFGIMFFVKVNSYADVVRDETVVFTCRNGVEGYSDNVIYYTWSYTLPSNVRRALYISYNSSYQGTPLGSAVLYLSSPVSNVSVREYLSYSGGNEQHDYVYNFTDSSSPYNDIYYCWNLLGSMVNNSFALSPNGASCPIFTDFQDMVSYLRDGTLPEKPFDDSIKLDKFKVYMRGVWNWDFLEPEFNQVVVCPIWSNPDIDEVVISIYAVNPSYRYNTVNWSFSGYESGSMKSLSISGLTLHDQKFVVRATPFTSYSRGVAIQYEFTFPENFDQPLGQLVIPSDNTYPYSTTIDISGNDVPIEWTVTQTPIYVYETNNIENYYYGDPVSYPVPEITENTENNYYETYVNNYYNTYNEVVNNYDVNFDIDISDVSGSDIQQTYDDFGNFFKGFGGFIGKLALLFSGLFPFLSPLVSTTLVAMVGIIVLGAIVILFLKVLHIL